MAQFDGKDIVTLSIAVLGAVLGIINTWHSMDERRVRLRVAPKFAFFTHGSELGEQMGCIEIINLSAFPVGVQEVGFTMSGKTRQTILAPITVDRQPFPRRLEPRQSVSAYFDLKAIRPGIIKAYVRTECGEVVYGNSPGLKDFARSL